MGIVLAYGQVVLGIVPFTTLIAGDDPGRNAHQPGGIDKRTGKMRTEAALGIKQKFVNVIVT